MTPTDWTVRPRRGGSRSTARWQERTETMRSRTFTAVWLAVGSVVAVAAVGPDGAGMSAERLERVTLVLDRYIDAGEIPGAVSLIYRHGARSRVSWREGARPLYMNRSPGASTSGSAPSRAMCLGACRGSSRGPHRPPLHPAARRARRLRGRLSAGGLPGDSRLRRRQSVNGHAPAGETAPTCLTPAPRIAGLLPRIRFASPRRAAAPPTRVDRHEVPASLRPSRLTGRSDPAPPGCPRSPPGSGLWYSGTSRSPGRLGRSRRRRDAAPAARRSWPGCTRRSD